MIGALYVFYGATLFGFGNIFAGAMGGIFKGVGLGLLLIGGLVLVMAIGLLMMAQWARKWAAEFYGFLAAFAIFLALFNFLLIPTAIVYLLIFFYLRRPATKAAFQEFGYERPLVHDAIASRKNAYKVEHKPAWEPGKPPEEPIINVPDNMVLCPQCQTLNLKSDQTCKMCATSLLE